jgi:DNA-binding response OmpR family regulator
MTSPPGTVRLAVIDTDSGFVRVLGKRLDAAGWEHRTLSSTIPAEELVAMKLKALIVDPDVLGAAAWDYLERVSAMLPDLALVIVSHGSTVAQRVRGLRNGADDWITKPAHPEEVIARVEAIVRRRRGRINREVGPVVAGELEIRPDQFQAFVAGRSLNLTRREFELVDCLAQANGKVLEREDIYQRVWGYAMAHGDRSVDVFIRKLRSKLQKASPEWAYVHTHFGVGYRFEPEPEDPSASTENAEASPEPQADQSNLRSQPFHRTYSPR